MGLFRFLLKFLGLFSVGDTIETLWSRESWWMEVITMSIVVGEYFRNMIPFSKPDEWNLDNINNAINKIKFIKCNCQRSHQCLEVRNLTTT